MTTEFDKEIDTLATTYGDAIPYSRIREVMGLDKTTLGDSLKAWRKCEAWTLAVASKKLNISIQLLSAYETGKRLPSFAKVVEMADIFGTDPSVWIYFRLQDELRALGFQAKEPLHIEKIAS
jgi:transcriptional regulator with XRE-family HTH domain